MSFDQNYYNYLLGTNPTAAQAYIADQAILTAPTPAPAIPQTTFQPPVAQPQAQGYVNPAAVQPQPTLARGTLEDFYNQPTGSGGGPSVTSKFFTKRAQGSRLQMRVISDVTNADVRQQTTPQNIPQTFKDGRPKFVLVVKVQVLWSSDGTHVTEFPDGLGSLWVKGVLADELRRSMAAAGDASGYPKGGSIIDMTSAGEQASRTPGFSATKLYQLQYVPPTVDPTAQAAPAPTTIPAVATPAPIATPPFDTAAPPVPAPSFTPPAPPVAIPDTRADLLAQLSGQ